MARMPSLLKAVGQRLVIAAASSFLGSLELECGVADAKPLHEHLSCGALEGSAVRLILNDQVGFERAVVLIQLPHV